MRNLSNADPNILHTHNITIGTSGSGSAFQFLGGGSSEQIQGPELLLCPIRPPSSYSDTSNSFLSLPPKGSLRSNDRAAALAAGLSQRFHSFGSTPLITGSSMSFDKPKRRVRNNSNGSLPPVPIRKSSRQYSNVSELPPTSARSTPTVELRKAFGRLDRAAGKDMAKSCNEKEPKGQSDKTKSKGIAKGCEERGSTTNNNCGFLTSCSIPISDIVIVDVDGTLAHTSRNDVEVYESNRMSVTTVVNGYFEFSFDSKNAHDVMLAFLQSCLPPERITNGGTLARQQERIIFGCESIRSEDVQSFDVDRFTAREINGWVEGEPMTNKLRRRFNRAASRLGELTLSVTECVCGGNVYDPNFQQRSSSAMLYSTSSYRNKRNKFDEADPFRRIGSGPSYIFPYE
eukprot:CAMPEP_0172520000 /NCGR_PEP_ID=MMETSP1066-20121228/291746_1 /TAXON_ID=671091 /ORGANISM="Coscinodiscus wailesii, Strain CCMP2513" /LENGTH=400 /DNA_ID=CAMNT_0013302679 /DNA_START=262 /DNA_END=1464 /DNA_ORIENTATION=-